MKHQRSRDRISSCSFPLNPGSHTKLVTLPALPTKIDGSESIINPPDLILLDDLAVSAPLSGTCPLSTLLRWLSSSVLSLSHSSLVVPGCLQATSDLSLSAFPPTVRPSCGCLHKGVPNSDIGDCLPLSSASLPQNSSSDHLAVVSLCVDPFSHPLYSCPSQLLRKALAFFCLTLPISSLPLSPVCFSPRPSWRITGRDAACCL